MMSETAFDNYGFGPKVKLDELLYEEPRRPATRYSSKVRDDENRGDAKDSRERTERRRPHPDDDASSVEVSSRRPQEKSRGGYYSGVPDRDDERRDDNEEGESDDGPSSAEGQPSSAFTDRDEVAYSKDRRRPYIRMKDSSSMNEDGPREYRPPSRDENQEPTDSVRSTLGHRRRPSYQPGDLPSFASEPRDKTEEANGGFEGTTQETAGDRNNGDVTSTTPGQLFSYTTENPFETTAYTERTTSLSPSSSNSRRQPAYGPTSNAYDSEQDEERPISTATEASSFRSTFEPPRYLSKDDERRPLDAAGDKFQTLLKNSQNRKLRKPASSGTEQLGAATTTSSFTGKENDRGRTKETKKRGGYATPPPLPPASSLILLARDPTPNVDQKAAATAVTSGADQKAAATGGSYRPRTLFHQQ
ncbi:unnamed protein product, partial [Ixodes hexagonus]